MATLKLDNSSQLYSISNNLINFVDLPTEITPLPLTGPEIEGLTIFKGRPLIQIDLGRALNLAPISTTGKRLILNSHWSNYALRVHEVMELGDPASKVIMVQLSAILPRTIIPLPKSPPELSTSCQQGLDLLLVASAQHTVALYTNNLDYLSALTGLTADTAEDNVLLKVCDQLLPTYSLLRLLGSTASVLEPIAIIVHGRQRDWALRVERALRFEHITEIYSSSLDHNGLSQVNREPATLRNPDSTRRIWYMTANDQIQEIMDADQLLQPASSVPLPARVANSLQPAQLVPTGQFTAEQGLRIDCGAGSYYFQHRLVARVFAWEQVVSRRRPPAATRLPMIPLLDSQRLLFGKPGPAIHQVALIQWGEQKMLVAIDHAVTLQTHWHLIDLPFPLSVLFDAVAWDNTDQRWILRFLPDISWANLPWRIRRAWVAAIVGWIDQQQI